MRATAIRAARSIRIVRIAQSPGSVNGGPGLLFDAANGNMQENSIVPQSLWGFLAQEEIINAAVFHAKET